MKSGLTRLQNTDQQNFLVLRRHVHKPAETAGELLAAYENEPPPKVAPFALQRFLNQRGRRSPGRR